MSLHNFNPNNRSWKMYTNTITSINTDDILIKPYQGNNLLLEVSGNNNIFFKKGDISYGLEDLIGVGNSSITLTNISGNIIPSTNNAFKLGDVSKYWSNAYIYDLSVTNISVSGNIIANGVNVTSTQLGYLNTITSNIQTQLTDLSNNKASLVASAFTGDITTTGNLNVSGNVVFGGSTLYTPASFMIDPASHGNNTGLVQINGNLQVLGTTTTINSSVVDISDKMIVLASNSLNSAQADGGGFEISGANVRFIYSDTSKTFNSSIGIGISGNLIPLNVNNTTTIGSTTNYWRNAYINNIDMSGDISNVIRIIPQLTNDISSSLGTISNTWQKAFIRDLSGIVSINGTNWPLTSGTSDFSGTDISLSLIPRNNVSIDLGTSTKYWRNAYIQNINATNISISGNITTDISNFRITTTHRIYQNICGDTSWNAINGYYGLAKNAFPALIPLTSGAKAISTWTRRTVTNSIGASLHSIVWSSKRGMFLGGGMNGLVYSSNGINWTFMNPGWSTATWASVTWSNELNLFVAVSSVGVNNVARTSNGVAWSEPVTLNNVSLSSICWSSERMLFVAVSSSGASRVRTSKNAIDWNSVDVPLSSWSSVCWSPELMIFVAVASDGNTAMYSSDGSNNWITTTVESSEWRCVCWSPELGLFVALANSGTFRAMTSYNGKDWNRINIQQNSYNSICWVSQLGLFIGTDGTGIIIYSQDGIVWTTTSSGSPAGLNGIAWSPELGILSSVGGQGAVMTSSLKGRPPTSYNVFDSPYNSIDELGKWTFLNTTTTTGFITDLSSLRIEVTNSVTPLTNNSGTLGSSNKYWNNAYIRDISVTNIEISGNMLPLRDISCDLGSSLKRWRNIYVHDLSVTRINGQIYGGPIDLTSVSGNIIPSSNNMFRLGDVSKNWSSAYINYLSVGSVDVSVNLNVSGNVVFGGSTLYTPASFMIDPASHGNNTGLVQINGNLQVLGTTTTINSSVVDISDKMIVLASNSLNSAQADGGGFEISGANVRFIYSDTSKTFNSSIGIGISGNILPINTTSQVPVSYSTFALKNSAFSDTHLGTTKNIWINATTYELSKNVLSINSYIKLEFKVNYISSPEAEQTISFRVQKNITGGNWANNNTDTVVFEDVSLGSSMGVTSTGIYNGTFIDNLQGVSILNNVVYYRLQYMRDCPNNDNIDVSFGIRSSSGNYIFLQEIYRP